ncbi:MAG: DUF4468 domain-containing protein [Bacteroidales bacterium]|nr:DUF4468 domain-containing protein [Bacteroidales bacterium]
MKRIFWLLISLFVFTIGLEAQIIRSDELEEYAKKKYGDNWLDAASNIGSKVELDKNNAITFVQVIDCGNQTKNQLYVILNYWFTSTFNQGDGNAIQLNDKEAGVIIARGFINDIAGHLGGGLNAYNVSIQPVIKVDIRDGKVRVTYTVPYYVVEIMNGGGLTGVLLGTSVDSRKENWLLDQTYPFNEKDKHKKVSAKSLVMTNAFSNVVLDKIEEAVKNGMSGNENDEW